MTASPPVTTTVRRASPADLPALATAVARAYQDDPVWSFLIPDPPRRETRLRRYFDLELRHVMLPLETTWTTADLEGGALCTPPGHWRLPPLTLVRRAPGFLHAFEQSIPRVLGALVLLERHHPRDDHYYLAYAGVVPELQGRGIGAELVRPLCRRCDSERLPAYLEATSERAAAFYERKGFAVTEEVRLRKGPPMWLMWREPGEAA